MHPDRAPHRILSVDPLLLLLKYLDKFFSQETLWNMDSHKGEQNKQAKAVPQSTKLGSGETLSKEKQTSYGNWGAV